MDETFRLVAPLPDGRGSVAASEPRPPGSGVVIEPDARFIQDVLAGGGSDLKKCFQCATCTAVCELAPDDSPFPRQQMIAAQWGLKERLMGDPALWLCYQCGDCTARCPRGARPGDVLGALRREAIRYYAFPRLLGALVANPKGWPLLFLLPILIFANIAAWTGGAPGGLHAGLEYNDLFPIPVLEALFFTVSALALLVFAVGVARFRRKLGTPILPGLAPALREIVLHRRFEECEERRTRRLGHLLAFWGFLGLAFVGTSVGIGTMAGVMHTPLDLASPWKIFANLAAVVALAGCVLLVAERIRTPYSTYFDWFFLATLAGVVTSGILSELLRLVQSAAWMYSVYFVHLVLIFALLLYAPYSKFAHLVYRTVAQAAELASRPAPKKG